MKSAQYFFLSSLFNLICNTTTFRFFFLSFDPNPGVEGVYEGKIFASVLFYFSFPLI